MDSPRSSVAKSAPAVIAAAATVAGLLKGSGTLSVVLFVVAGLALLTLVGVWLGDVLAWAKGVLRRAPKPVEPQPAFTSLWRNTTEGLEAPSASTALQKRIHHPAFAKLGYTPEPAKVVLTCLVACGPIGDTPSTTEQVNAFIDLLSSPVVGKLTSILMDVPGGMSWHSYGTNGRLNNNAILARSTSDDEIPIATAFLNLNDSTVKFQHFQDPKRAELVIVMYPEVLGLPFKTMTLQQWQGWFVQALKVPELLSNFLADEITVPTYDDPTAIVGVMLEATGDLTQMIDISEFQQSPGMSPSRQFPMYLIAERTGKEPQIVALDALRVLCDHGLHVLGYEKQLDQLRMR